LATFGFPRRYRLTRPAEFSRALRFARYRKNHGALRILAVANTMPSARLGLIVGKRAVRQAHERNMHKRIAREAFRAVRAQLPAVDVVVHMRAPAGRRELRSMLEEEFSKMAAKPDKALCS